MASRFGDINGVRLTKIDEDQQYAQESLGVSLQSADSGRHVCRVAHLYFARGHLTSEDWEVNLLALMRKIFGTSTKDFGWLHQVSHGSVDFKIKSRRLFEEMKTQLDAVFDPNGKFDSEQLKGFRLIQLLHPQDHLNLFQLIFAEATQEKPYLYLFPLSDFPVHVQTMLKSFHAKLTTKIPELYVSLVGNPPRVVGSAATNYYVELVLPDWFTVQFLLCFLLPHQESNSVKKKNLLLTNKMTTTKKSVHTLHDAVHNNPALELLEAYFSYFFVQCPFASRKAAIFRWSVVDFWLNNPSAVESHTLLRAVQVLILFLPTAPDSVQTALQPSVISFLLLHIKEADFQDDLPLGMELVDCLVISGTASTTTIAVLFLALLNRMDTESNPALVTVNAFLLLANKVLTDSVLRDLFLVEEFARDAPRLWQSLSQELSYKLEKHEKLTSVPHLWKHFNALVPSSSRTTTTTPTSLLAQADNAPHYRFLSGVPKWMKSTHSSATTRFQALTESGRNHVSTTANTLQYMGDYNFRPLEKFEIPLVVSLCQVLFQGRGRSVLADVRNVLWVLCLVMGLTRSAFLSMCLALVAVYCMGASVLRGTSLSLWNVLLVVMVVGSVVSSSS